MEKITYAKAEEIIELAVREGVLDPETARGWSEEQAINWVMQQLKADGDGRIL